MIALAKVKEIERLLALGTMSQRQIAAAQGVSRATVGAIADGTRPSYEARRRAELDGARVPLGPIKRCPTCGGRVYMPCRLCLVRKFKAEQAARRARDIHRP
jgi:hypothetical protein